MHGRGRLGRYARALGLGAPAPANGVNALRSIGLWKGIIGAGVDVHVVPERGPRPGGWATRR